MRLVPIADHAYIHKAIANDVEELLASHQITQKPPKPKNVARRLRHSN